MKETLPSGTTAASERIDVEETKDRFQAALHQQRFEFALGQIGRIETALEIGTGTGSFSRMLAERCDSYTGIDFDPASVAMTAKRLNGKGRVMQADARNLPFEPQTFSAIVCLEVLEHLGDFVAGVAGIHKCLTEDGVAVISVPYRRKGRRSDINPYHPYEPGERELLAELEKRFHERSVFYQYFEETMGMTVARVLHVRRLAGLDRPYAALSSGEPEAVACLKIGAKPAGMKLGLIVVARRPKGVPDER
jgi:SAM-dependent methyltransferase